MEKLIKKYLKNYKITEKQAFLLKKYYNLLIIWNEKINLTAITEEEDVVIKHFLDSVIYQDIYIENSTIVDIGTGAGFPSIPLKILRPDLNFTLVDSLNKRINFLNLVINELNLQKIECIHARSEDLANKKEYREKFDYCISRAVANLNTLSEYCLPFVKINGKFVAYKGENANFEKNEAKNAILMLGGAFFDEKKYELPKNAGSRSLLIYKKVKNTPKKFPRNGNKPRLQPLK